MTEFVPAPMLKATGLIKSYDLNGVTVQALRGVDLNIADGEFVAMMGPSGCGKSTFLHLLGGLDRPTGGEIFLAGQRVDQLSETKWARLRRRQIGFVFLFFNLIPNLTVADNIELPALLAGVSAVDARNRRMALLEDLGIDTKADISPARLSGGQQQRVALARALINRPALLLADEPTGNLDSNSAKEVLRLIRRTHEQGQTILLVTHDARVASVADRVLTMRDGLIADDAAMKDGRFNSPIMSQFVGLEADR
jgi:putative ABC transport system ATP-binding protein